MNDFRLQCLYTAMNAQCTYSSIKSVNAFCKIYVGLETELQTNILPLWNTNVFQAQSLMQRNYTQRVSLVKSLRNNAVQVYNAINRMSKEQLATKLRGKWDKALQSVLANEVIYVVCHMYR